jgi:glutamate racemase
MAQPIGIFDSGLGGLSVLRYAKERFPDEAFIYLADQRRAPYGDRSREEIFSYTNLAVNRLIELDVKGVVIACNTASDVALERMRELHPDLPFVGIEPAVKPAVASSQNGIVGVLATTGTVTGSRLRSLISKYAGASTVLTQACPGLVELIEDGLGDSKQAEALLREYVNPLVAAGVDTLVIGCTHYSFVAGCISDIAGPAVRIIDPADAVAKQIGRAIPIDGTAGVTRYETSGDAVRMRRQLQEMFDEESPPVYPSP